MNHDCVNCKHYTDALEETNGFCTKLCREVASCQANSCKHFEQLTFCDTCKWANIRVYETGTIDSVDYRCILQNNKLIYSDLNPMRIHNADYPECEIFLYEEDK